MTVARAAVAITKEQRRYAQIAGLALLLICLSVFLSNNPIVPGGAVATAHNVIAHERWFRVGIVGELFMANCDIMLAVAFWAALRPVNALLALLGLLWRFRNALLLGVGVVVSLFTLDTIDDSHCLAAFQSDQTAAMVSQLLDVHGPAMAVGLSGSSSSGSVVPRKPVSYGLRATSLAFSPARTSSSPS